MISIAFNSYVEPCNEPAPEMTMYMPILVNKSKLHKT